MKRTLIVTIIMLMNFSLRAQTLPSKPIPHVHVDLIDDATHQRVKMDLPVVHRTADRSFWLWTIASAGMSIADAENTVHCLKQPNCQETNPLLGRHPSRARLYSLGLPIFAATTYIGYRAKRRDDAAKAFDAKLAWTHWWIAPLTNIASHGVGILITIASTGR